MKKINSYILGMAAFAALAIGAPACQDDVDAPKVDIPHATMERTISILDLKTEFWNEATNYAAQIKDENDPDHRYIIAGRVASSDESGNINQVLILQDETSAIQLSISSYNLYLKYRVGQEIVMDLTDMYIGKYNGMLQVGRPEPYRDTYEITRMSPELFSEHIELNGLPEVDKVDTIQIANFGRLAQTSENLIKYQGQLVCLQNVHWQDAGQAKFAVYHENTNTTLIDSNDASMTVRTSGYSNFWNQLLPTGNLDVVGILGYYGTQGWQLTLIDNQSWKPAGDRPGSADKPYTVDQVIEVEADGGSGEGWVTGYIVGAVAPEVETISSNNDIEWEAPTVLNNTLVIAPAADCKEIAQCLVIALPANSALRQYGNLHDNPANLGKKINIKATFEKYMGTFGLGEISGKAADFNIEGLTIDSGEFPEGVGTEESPYNVAQVVAMNPSSTTEAVESGVWVKGYIVGSMPTGGSSTTLSGTNFSTEDAATTNLVIGPTPDCTNPALCVGVQLSTSIRGELALANKPENLGKVLSIKGDVMKYCGGPGVKNGNLFKLEGDGGSVTPPPSGDDTDVAAGDGQKATPYNVPQIIALNPTSTTEAVESGVWAKGYIVGSMPTGGSSTTLSATNFSTVDAATTNLVLGPTANCTDPSKCISIQLPTAIRGDLALANKPENLGKLLAIKGDVMKYCGGPGIKNGSEFELEGGTTPVVPPVSGSVTSLNENFASGSIPSSWTSVMVAGNKAWYATSFNGTYYAACTGYKGSGAPYESWLISPAVDMSKVASKVLSFRTQVNGYNSTSTDFGVYVLTSNAPAEGNPVKLNATLATAPASGYSEWVNSGSLDLSAYSGTIYIGFKYSATDDVTATWCVTDILLNSEGGTTPGGDTPGGDTPGGDTPADPSGDVVTIGTANFKGADNALLTNVTVDGYTFTIDKSSGATAPAYNEYNGAGTIRLYADNTINIAGAKMAKIEFVLNTATGAKRYTSFTPSTGAVAEQKADDTMITWTGDATSVTFTVGHDATIGSDGPSKRGQIHISEMKIYPAK